MKDEGVGDSQLVNLHDLDFDALTAFVLELGEPKFRAKQIWEWLYIHNASGFDEMTSLSKSLREKLAVSGRLTDLDVEVRQESNDQQTTKYLFKLKDGQLIETVLMRYEKRRTACISTQAGCAMGCVFCATGQMGFMRNLSVGEIVSQITYLNRELGDQKLTNVVMMGMGEPLHNYDNTLTALDRLTDNSGINLGARKITISTVGLIPAMKRYADEKRQTPLAVSLHAATDPERNKLIPVNQKWPIADLIEACEYVVAQTGRRITFEWALIAGKTDTEKQARAFGALVGDLLCHVNLIPLNPTNGYDGRPTSREDGDRFQEILAEYGVSSTVRVRRGIDIQAGCGQLRDRVIADAHGRGA